MRATDALESRTALGRNLTFGLLDLLGRMIVTGAYDGRPFPIEAELSKEHSVSRSVTREAVKMLAAKGLLTARPRQGTIITPPAAWNWFDTDVLRWLLERKFSLSLLRQFTELRLSIEPGAAALAAQSGSAEGFDLIQRGFARMEAAEIGNDNPLTADIAFHVSILEASGNPFYAQFRDVVATALQTSIQFTNRYRGRSASLPSHKMVLDAIIARDPETAASAMRSLIADVMSLINEASERQGEA
jgi:DNA-binding FadR family transcriptional regulator